MTRPRPVSGPLAGASLFPARPPLLPLLLPVLQAVLLALLLAPAPALADRSTGQTLYVPCYSQVYHGIKTRPLDLTVTLFVHNTNPAASIQVTAVDYHATGGQLLRAYLKSPADLPPLATREFIVEQTDVAGGAGGNFLVRWKSAVPVNPPMVETVMIGTSSNLGISFTSPGRVIEE